MIDYHLTNRIVARAHGIPLELVIRRRGPDDERKRNERQEAARRLGDLRIFRRSLLARGWPYENGRQIMTIRGQATGEPGLVIHQELWDLALCLRSDWAEAWKAGTAARGVTREELRAFRELERPEIVVPRVRLDRLRRAPPPGQPFDPFLAWGTPGPADVTAALTGMDEDQIFELRGY